MRKQNIVLVGFRGVGKSKYGKALAQVLGLPFADLDEEAEFILGESIMSFVDKYGWQEFRAIEQKVVHDFSRNFSGVIATGGGTIENSKNLQNLKKNGLFVFLNPSFLKVKKYLLSDEAQVNRPRINPSIPLSQEIDQMWEQRKDIYSATADYEVNPDFDNEYLEEAKKIAKVLPAKNLPLAPPNKKVAIFSSEKDHILAGVLEAKNKGRIPNVEFSLFVTNDPKSKSLKVARSNKINQIEVLQKQDEESIEDYNRLLINIVRQAQPDHTILIGWSGEMSQIYAEQFGKTTYASFPSIINQHFGQEEHKIFTEVLDNEEKYAGCTIHKITSPGEDLENLLQRKILISKENTESLKKKVELQEILGFCEALERRK